MSTSEVLQLCLVIIGICSLFIQVSKKEMTAGVWTTSAIISMNSLG